MAIADACVTKRYAIAKTLAALAYAGLVEGVNSPVVSNGFVSGAGRIRPIGARLVNAA